MTLRHNQPYSLIEESADDTGSVHHHMEAPSQGAVFLFEMLHAVVRKWGTFALG